MGNFLTLEQRDTLVKTYLGKTVDVVVDRPVGYAHDTDIHYPVNYGYLPGVTGGDGEEQDVYILGVEEPLDRFIGRIIGAIRRRDDCEDKLVAAPEGVLLHQGQIAEQVHFVERYFSSTIDSLYRKSCGVIPYRRSGREVQVLLVFQRRSQSWSFPKGHMEAWEEEQDTALRELREETGLRAGLEKDFRAAAEYPVWSGRKQVVLFLGEARGMPEPEQRELEGCRWVTIGEARALLGDAYGPVLERVEDFFDTDSQ